MQNSSNFQCWKCGACWFVIWLNIISIGICLQDRNFCVYFINLERLISIFNVGNFKFEDQCLIHELTLTFITFISKIYIRWRSMLDPEIHNAKVLTWDKFLLQDIPFKVGLFEEEEKKESNEFWLKLFSFKIQIIFFYPKTYKISWKL